MSDTLGRARHLSRQDGSMALFVCMVVLPLMFFLFSLSVDLETYYRATQRAQTAADSASLYASRFLPFATQASQAARSYLDSYGQIVKNADIQVSSDYLSIAVRSTIEPNFPQLLGIHLSLPVRAYSKSRTTPIDVFLAMDTSAYVAPDLISGAAWGDLGQWGAAQFFTSLAPELNGVPVDPLLATEQCFNPAFNALKQATIATYDYLAGFHLNQIGLGFFPGRFSDLDVVREIFPGGARPLNFSPVGGESDFAPYSTLLNSDAYCAAASEQELANDRYRLPEFDSALGQEWQQPLDHPSSMIIPGTWIFDPSYQDSLRARQVVWSRVAKAGTPETAQVIQSLVTRLIAPPPVAQRGGLNRSTLKKGVLFSADVPRANGQRFLGESDGVVAPVLAATLNSVGQQAIAAKINLRLYYVILAGDYVPAGILERAQALQSMFDRYVVASQDPQASFAIKTVIAKSPQELSHRVVGELMIDSKTVMISR